jgi:hypothetical protein
MSAPAIYLSQPTYRIWWRVKATEGTPASSWYKMMTGDKALATAEQEIAHYSAKHPSREYCLIPSGDMP